jgi:hypothetical protein
VLFNSSAVQQDILRCSTPAHIVLHLVCLDGDLQTEKHLNYEPITPDDDKPAWTHASLAHDWPCAQLASTLEHDLV